MAIQLTSSAFENGAQIPVPYTCADRDISPPLRWSGVPTGTQSLALVLDDPDAARGIWVHWVIWNIPADTGEFPPDVPPHPTQDNGARQGRNDSHTVGYSGPCPPPGPAHRYRFTLYALDTMLALEPGATRAQLLRAMKGHVLAEGQLIGLFGQ